MPVVLVCDAWPARCFQLQIPRFLTNCQNCRVAGSSTWIGRGWETTTSLAGWIESYEYLSGIKPAAGKAGGVLLDRKMKRSWGTTEEKTDSHFLSEPENEQLALPQICIGLKQQLPCLCEQQQPAAVLAYNFEKPGKIFLGQRAKHGNGEGSVEILSPTSIQFFLRADSWSRSFLSSQRAVEHLSSSPSYTNHPILKEDQPANS